MSERRRVVVVTGGGGGIGATINVVSRRPLDSADTGLVERLGWRHVAQDRRGGEVKNPLLAM